MGVLVELCGLSTASRSVNPVQHSISKVLYKLKKKEQEGEGSGGYSPYSVLVYCSSVASQLPAGGLTLFNTVV